MKNELYFFYENAKRMKELKIETKNLYMKMVLCYIIRQNNQLKIHAAKFPLK